MRRASWLPLIILIFAFISPSAFQAAKNVDEYDLLITGGRIVDGAGNPWIEADLAIEDGKIAAIGKLASHGAKRQIDARGLVIAPGFIDVHTHIEGGINNMPNAENFLQMGVTSVVTGNCGSSILKMEEWMSNLEKNGISINVATLVGHNSVRRAGMNGDFDRPPTPEELEKMRELVDQAMRAGAVGLSSGLEYIPGTYAKTDEISALAKVAASYGGLYTTHMRNEGLDVEKSIRESIAIGEVAGCPVDISHFKVSSKRRWGASTDTIKLVADARSRGQQVTVDQYLYVAASTGIGILFPSWLFEGGNDKTRERLMEPQTRVRVRREILAKARRDGFLDLSFAVVANHRADTTFNGKSIAEIAKIVRKKSTPDEQAEQAIEILLNGGAQMVLHKMSEPDVARIIRQPFTMVASDAGIADIGGDSLPHPRGFGNNARVLARYVREQKLIGLEDAIRKMSSLPAQTFNLWDRGLIRPGMAADLVIFDEKTITDRATFEQPKQYPVGIDYVLVNGEVTIEKGKHTGARKGQVLRLKKRD
jgi:N-acyl-D-amino-acid deacylase